MSKFFNGKVKIDDQVTEFDMSELAKGKLTLPAGAVKNLSELDEGILLGTANAPVAEGGRLIQEKHVKDIESAASAARDVIAADLSAEVTRATGAEQANATAIANEEAARIAADGVLQGNIDTEKARIDAMLSGSSVNFDTLKEIVDAYQLADTDIVSSITSLSNSLNVEVADRIADVDAEETRALAAEAALQAELDASQAAAGLAADGTFVAHVGSNFMDAATSLQGADIALDAALKAEEGARQAADTTLQNNIDALSGAVAADFAQVETDIQASFANVQAELDATQAGAGLDAAGGYVADALRNYIGAATSLDNADQLLDAALKVEEGARIAEDTALSGAINDEVARALAAEAVLQSNIDAEESARIAADNTLQTNINNEAATRAAADTTLQSNIDVEKGRIDAILSGSTVDFDTLKEIVDAYQLADTDIVNSITSLSNSLSAEVSDRAAGDSALQAELDASQAGAGLEANGGFLAHVGSNYMDTAVSLKDSDVKLDAALKTEEGARISGDTTLQNNIDALSGAVAADFASLETDFLAEVARVESESDAAEATLTTNLANEVTRAQGEEARIEGKFDAHFDGFVKVAGLTEVDTAMGSATHYVVNSATVGKSFEIPAMTEGYFIMIKVAEASESVIFNAATGESIDGEADGSFTLHGGSSVMVVKQGGVMYLF